MLTEKPHIHMFNLYNNYYMYDVNSNSIFEIPKEIHDYLSVVMSIDNQTVLQELYDELSFNSKKGLEYFSKQGLLKPVQNTIKFEHVETNRLEEIYNGNLKNITLQVTQNCNLRCKYCVYSGSYSNRTHTNKRMSFETAKKALDFFNTHSSNNKKLTIGFYGGEPLLEFDLIKKSIEYAKEIFYGKELFFTMTTNGTIMNEKIIELLSDNNLHLVISLDGAKKIQDANRVFADNNTGTFDTVINNIEKIKNINEHYLNNHISFNAVIDLSKDFNCANDFFVNYDTVKNLGVTGNFINTTTRIDEYTIDDQYAADSQYEIFKVFLNKCTDVLKNYESRLLTPAFESLIINIHNRKVVNNENATTTSPGGQCIPGIQRFFVTSDGVFYPCERVNETEELSIGDIDDGFNLEKAKKILNVGKLTEKECRQCWNFQLCSHCISTCEQNGVLSRTRRLSRCNDMKTSTENQIKNYITLKKYGCDFEESR